MFFSGYNLLILGKEGKILDMATRLDIAIDIAHAITYLHMYTRKSIYK